MKEQKMWKVTFEYSKDAEISSKLNDSMINPMLLHSKKNNAKRHIKKVASSFPGMSGSIELVDCVYLDSKHRWVETTELIYLYRVEGPGQGIWRNDDRTTNEIYKKLSCKNMPMDDSDFYSEGGREWVSSCCNMETLRNWFGEPDGAVFKENGYKMWRYAVPNFLVRDANPFEKVFCKEDALERVEVDGKMLYESWDL